jgi:hypothetical protein
MMNLNKGLCKLFLSEETFLVWGIEEDFDGQVGKKHQGVWKCLNT